MSLFGSDEKKEARGARVRAEIERLDALPLAQLAEEVMVRVYGPNGPGAGGSADYQETLKPFDPTDTASSPGSTRSYGCRWRSSSRRACNSSRTRRSWWSRSRVATSRDRATGSRGRGGPRSSRVTSPRASRPRGAPARLFLVPPQASDPLCEEWRVRSSSVRSLGAESNGERSTSAPGDVTAESDPVLPAAVGQAAGSVARTRSRSR